MCYISDMLREKINDERIDKKRRINLDDFKWEKQLEEEIMNIQLIPEEGRLKTLRQVYELGFNIPNSGLTSRYIAHNMKNTKVIYGYTTFTEGLIYSAKNCKYDPPLFNYTFVKYKNDYIIDPTLKIIMKLTTAVIIGYVPELELSETKLTFSKYNLYSHLINEQYRNSVAFKRKLLSLNHQT